MHEVVPVSDVTEAIWKFLVESRAKLIITVVKLNGRTDRLDRWSSDWELFNNC